MTTTHVKAAETEERWFLYDASKYPLGRMAAKIAMNLMGKDLPTWTPSERSNTHVVVINSATPRLTGKKSEAKVYTHYTGYTGGQRHISIEKVRENRPADIVTLAVRRMLPKTRLGHDILRHLKVYGGSEHPHSAQQPVPVESI